MVDLEKPPSLVEAKRLKSIWLERKKQDPTLTQDRLAELCGWAGQSVVSQYMNGKIPLNHEALFKFAKALHFRMEDVSPRLAEPVTTVIKELQRMATAQPISSIGNSKPELFPVEVWDDTTPLGPDEVELPFFQEVELSAGKGSEVMLETGGRKLRFGRRTLQRKGVTPETAACAPVAGNSMEPVLPDGSTVGIDTAAKQIQDGKMYAIDHGGQLRVKLLYRLPGGGLRIRSYNSDEYPDERYEGDYAAEHIRIIGKVFWYSVLL